MSDEYLRSELPFVRPQEFDDARARHAVRLAMETIGKGFYWLGLQLEHEQRCRHGR